MKALATTSDEHFRASSAEYIRHPHAPCKTRGAVAEVHPYSKQMGERRSANGLTPPLEGKPAETTHECVVPRKQA
jgi:hypothetical protein